MKPNSYQVNLFTGGGNNLKPPYAGITSNYDLSVPTAGIKGYAGMYLKNLRSSFSVGAYGVSTTFSNLSNGIISINNNLSVANTEFTNIVPSVSSGIIGTGIYATGNSQLGICLPNGGGGLPQSPAYSLSVTRAQFSTMHKGIYADRINTSVYFCTIQTALTDGIYVANNKAGYTDIGGNTISTASVGVNLQNNDPYYQQYVVRNDITTIGLLSSGNAINDVETGGLPQNTTNTTGIVGNSITIDGGAKNGIFVQGAKKPIVQQHSGGHYISMLSPNYARSGIYLAGCSNAFVSQNEISGTNTTAVNNTLYPAAIQIDGANNTDAAVCANTLNNTYTGILLNGTNTGLKMGQNIIQNHNTGLRVKSGAIQAQTSGSNQWTASSYAGNSAINYSVLWAGWAPLYYQAGSANIYHPSAQASPSNWFLPGALSDCCGDESMGLSCLGTVAALTPLQTDIVNHKLTFTDFQQEQQWQAEATLYEEMNVNEDLQRASGEAGKFFEAKDAGSTGQLARIRSRAEEFEQNPMTQALADLVGEKQQLMQQWATADSLWAAAQTAEERVLRQSESETVRQQIERNTLAIQELSVLLYQAQETEAKRLLAENSKIVPECLVPQNEQLFNEVWLRTTFFNRTDYDPKQIRTIEYLAFQCPLEGGLSVYKARSLYAAINDSILFNDDSLCTISLKRLKAGLSDVREESI